MQNRYLTTDMKNILALSMLVSSMMICSCQKQESTAQQQQLDQRKVELDAREEALAERKTVLDGREKALDERQNALDKREKALAQKEQAARTNPTDVQGQTVNAERDSITQQLSASAPNRSQLEAQKAQKESGRQQQSQRELEFKAERERVRQLKLTGAFMAGDSANPAASTTSSTPPPAQEDTSASPSQTPE